MLRQERVDLLGLVGREERPLAVARKLREADCRHRPQQRLHEDRQTAEILPWSDPVVAPLDYVQGQESVGRFRERRELAVPPISRHWRKTALQRVD